MTNRPIQPEHNPEETPRDEALDRLLDEALSARHLPAPKGMDERLLKAIARAQAGPVSPDNQGPEPAPVDPALDDLLDEALCASSVPLPQGMNDRILQAVAQARRPMGADELSEQERQIAGRIDGWSVRRWLVIGLAATLLFAVSAGLLLRGGGIDDPTSPMANKTDPGNRALGEGTVNTALLELELNRFNDLGANDADPLDRDLAALSARIDQAKTPRDWQSLNKSIDQLNQMWPGEANTKPETGEF